ncbi:unnamed protein product [Alopecurus aequalis]
MTPVPENHVAVQLKPVPASPGDRSMAGKTIDASSRRQPPIVEKSLFPLKKRAMSDVLYDSFVIPSKKKRVDTGSDGTSAYGYDMAAPPEPSSFSEITPEQQTKLMHNGILPSGSVRSTRRPFSHALAAAAYDGGAMDEAETSAAGAKKNRNRNRNNRYTRPPRLYSHSLAVMEEAEPSSSRAKKKKTVKYNRPRQSARGAELSRRLEALGATAERFVCTKTLHNSDVSRNQNRLLFSCKREFLATHPITALLSKKDTYFVFQHEHGLRVSAYDGEGREFGMKLRYLDSNGGYRLIGEWGLCVEKNELRGPVLKDGCHVDVELWAFRSPELPEQPQLNDGDRQDKVDGLEGDPNGKLGLLFLPYVDDGEGAEEDVERAPPPPTVHEMTKRRASAKAPREERRLAEDGAVRASRGKMKGVESQVTFSELVAEHGLEKAHSLAALIKLSYCCVVPPI